MVPMVRVLLLARARLFKKKQIKMQHEYRDKEEIQSLIVLVCSLVREHIRACCLLDDQNTR